MIPTHRELLKKIEHNVLRHKRVGKPTGILLNLYNKKRKVDNEDAEGSFSNTMSHSQAQFPDMSQVYTQNPLSAGDTSHTPKEGLYNRPVSVYSSDSSVLF